jgi:hypothetical protein
MIMNNSSPSNFHLSQEKLVVTRGEIGKGHFNPHSENANKKDDCGINADVLHRSKLS